MLNTLITLGQKQQDASMIKALQAVPAWGLHGDCFLNKSVHAEEVDACMAQHNRSGDPG